MKNNPLIKTGLLVSLLSLGISDAQEAISSQTIKPHTPPIPEQHDDDVIEKLEKNIINQKSTNEKLADNLPSEQSQKEKIQQALDYLKTHPKELENVFLHLIRQKNVAKIKLLLPLYMQYPKKDMSLIDWGSALIYEERNDYHQAVNIYRKMNSALPHIKTLRFHMANALFRDKQYEAAKSEFEKLRSEDLPAIDKEVINSYLDAIREQNTWTFDANVTYINDKNLNNTAPKGTTLFLPDGTELSVKNDPEEGQGFSYGFGIGKKIALQSNYFTSLNASIDGTYYWNNHKYDDLTVGVSAGLGYEDAKKSVEFSPFFNNRLYAGVKEDNDKLSQYAKTFGVRVTGSLWLTPQWHYNSALSIAKNDYVKAYDHMDGDTISLYNSLSYMPSPTRYFYSGINISSKDTVYDDDSTKKVGFRAGWSEAWGKGFSTSLGFGLSKTVYQGVDWLGIRRKDVNFSVNSSIWNRNIHFWGITPKVSYYYNKNTSNNKLNEYKKHNVFLEFSKTF